MTRKERYDPAAKKNDTSANLIMKLEDPSCTNVDAAGTKAARLARLLQDGFPVPDGIVVVAEAFRHHLRGLSSEKDGTSIRNRILSRPLDDRLREELFQALSRIGDIPVAVRSSGSAEDLVGASFAGQYNTFLGVQGVEAIEKAIRKCWASAFSEHILRYRTAKQIQSGSMAVLIQPMVNADAAGGCLFGKSGQWKSRGGGGQCRSRNGRTIGERKSISG